MSVGKGVWRWSVGLGNDGGRVVEPGRPPGEPPGVPPGLAVLPGELVLPGPPPREPWPWAKANVTQAVTEIAAREQRVTKAE
ncbi:MAG: hypothetical protein IT166_11605 [Bryobacterales bacterium]|nr:hypothetical protein [Bryobacterales bacterium]